MAERKLVGEVTRRKDGRLELRFVTGDGDPRGDGLLVLEEADLGDAGFAVDRVPATGEVEQLYEVSE